MNWFTPDKVGEVPQSMIITPLYIQNKDFILEHFAIHFAILMLSTEVSGIQLCPFRAVSVFVSTFRSPHVLLEKRVCYTAGNLVKLWTYKADDI